MKRLALAALLLLAPATAAAQPAITVDEVFEIAASGVGSPYVWGGGCWDPSDRSRLGADCSGYVAKVWQVPERSDPTVCSHPYTTATFYHESVHWDAVDRSTTRPADAMVYRSDGAGHVVLFESGDPWGNSVVYEARGSAYGIVHRTRAMDSAYRTRRRRALVTGGPDDPIVPETPGSHPSLVLSVEAASIVGQARELCALASSQEVFDAWAGQMLIDHLFITNEGGADAPEVVVGIDVDDPHLLVAGYEVFDDSPDNPCGGGWCANDANHDPDNPPLDAPGQTFHVELGTIARGDTILIYLDLVAREASFGEGSFPAVRLWVRSVQGYYSKPTFDGAYDNVDGLQTWNGGDLKAFFEHTILGEERCNGLDDDCDGFVDGGLGVGEPCSIGSGPCAGEGFLACAADGHVFCDVQPSGPLDELCDNGVDDDCDGLVDEGCGDTPDPSVDPGGGTDPGSLTPGGGSGSPSMEGACACHAAPPPASSAALWLAIIAAMAARALRDQSFRRRSSSSSRAEAAQPRPRTTVAHGIAAGLRGCFESAALPAGGQGWVSSHDERSPREP